MSTEHTPTAPDQQAYDVFLSFAGPDRDTSRALREELGSMGLNVFLDEYSIELGQSITRTIIDALGSSKLFVAYYSKHFTNRPACQIELGATYVAAQRSGDPTNRIMAVNPEATTDHIVPSQLIDRSHPLRATNSKALALAAQEIGHRTEKLTGGLGDITILHHPVWYGRFLRSRFFAGRYKEQWELHTALTGTDQASTTVVGQPGTGKTTLVEQYAARFGHMFSGGVYWLGQNGAYDVANPGEPSLWILDDAPSDISFSDLYQRLPSVQQAHAILIKEEDTSYNQFPTINVGALTTEESLDLMTHYREPDGDNEKAALRQLVKELGYHAGTLAAASQDLQDMQGLISYESYLAKNEQRYE